MLFVCFNINFFPLSCFFFFCILPQSFARLKPERELSLRCFILRRQDPSVHCNRSATCMFRFGEIISLRALLIF